MNNHIAWFEEIGKEDIAMVGGKGANLGEMFNAGIPVPYGFVVTSYAYFDFLKESGIKKKIAGYECKKAIVETKNQKGETNKTDVWYCEKLQGVSNTSSGMGTFKGLKGASLEFSAQQGPMKIQMTATNVSTAPVADSKFVISTEGYTEIKAEDLKKQRGGN